MNAQDARQAVDYALSSFEGEPVYVDDSTIVIGMDSDSGRYWVADNGDEVNGLDYDAVMQFCIDALAKQAEYAETVYATPDEWGSITVYADEAGMQTTIASLIDAGGEEWAGINLGDCAEWDLVQVINGIGIYQEQYVRGDGFITLEMAGNGEYTEREAFATLEDAIEELSK
ncbi:MAG: hypothetical protein KAX65_00010 [Caldilineaceae bacterium]|nr:hypothetical protein [Caldilineaceae bacterium]